MAPCGLNRNHGVARRWRLGTRRLAIGAAIAFALPLALARPRPTRAAEVEPVANPTIVAAIQPFVDRHEIAGAVALVTTKDKLLCLEPIGRADVDAGSPMRADTMFWIASMTKSLTTTAMMMLVDEGKLDINDPVEKYLPEFKNVFFADPASPGGRRAPRHPVTVRELLGHTHGMSPAKTQSLSLADDVAAFVAEPMEAEPGTRYKYSNVSMTTGGRIIEVLGGMAYADFLQQRLLTPLGMTDTTFWPNEAQVARLAPLSSKRPMVRASRTSRTESSSPPAPWRRRRSSCNMAHKMWRFTGIAMRIPAAGCTRRPMT